MYLYLYLLCFQKECMNVGLIASIKELRQGRAEDFGTPGVLNLLAGEAPENFLSDPPIFSFLLGC